MSTATTDNLATRLRAYSSNPAAFRDNLIIQAAGRAERFGGCMAEFQRAGFAALDAGLIALANGERPAIQRFWWERTKGASKDSDLAIALCWLLAFSPRALECQVGAGDLEQAAEVRKAIQTLLRLNPWLARILVVRNWTISNPATGSACSILASDAPSAHGSRPDLCIINELSHIGREDFAETLADNSAKIPAGVMCIATNAGFVGSWQWRWRELARTSPRWHFSAYSQPAPWIDAAELAERERTSSPNRFRRLWHGEWVSAASEAVAESDIVAMFARGLPQLDGTQQGYEFVGGLDLSVSRDHSAFVIVAKNASGRYRVARCWLWKPLAGGKIDLEQVEKTIGDAHKAFRFKAIVLDPYQGEYLASRLRKSGVPIEARPQTGKALVEQCCMLLEQINSHNLDAYKFEPLERDLRRLRVEEKSYGMRLVSERGPDGHGDTVTALSIAIAIAKDIRVTGPRPAVYVPPAFGAPGHKEYADKVAAKVARLSALGQQRVANEDKIAEKYGAERAKHLLYGF